MIQFQNPCSAKLKFLYANMTKCDGYRDPLPDFLIIGPQKTGNSICTSMFNVSFSLHISRYVIICSHDTLTFMLP